MFCTGAVKAAKTKICRRYKAVKPYSGSYRSHASTEEALQDARITMGAGGGGAAVFGVFALVGVCMEKTRQATAVQGNAGGAGPAEPAGASPEEQTDLTRKLEALREALSAGLITEDEYASKRAELLNRF